MAAEWNKANLEKDMASIEDLPIDIFLDILKRLPTTSLVCCRGVSKAWRDLATDHPDLKESLKRRCAIVISKDDPHRLHIIQGNFFHDKEIESKFTTEIDLPFMVKSKSRITCLLSCNGYVLLGCMSELSDRSIQEVYVCNPLKKTFARLPESSGVFFSKGSTNSRYTYGFGFLPANREFKVVRIVSRGIKQWFYVFTFGLSYWRHVDSGPFIAAEDKNGVLFNGTLNWVGFTSANNLSQEVIVSFDLREEKFSSIPLPISYGYQWNLAVLGGCLSAYGSCNGEMAIWRLEKNGGNGLWSQIFYVRHNYRYYANLLSLPENGKIFLMHYNGHCVSYDPEAELFSRHNWVNLRNALHVTTFDPSLV